MWSKESTGMRSLVRLRVLKTTRLKAKTNPWSIRSEKVFLTVEENALKRKVAVRHCRISLHMLKYDAQCIMHSTWSSNVFDGIVCGAHSELEFLMLVRLYRRRVNVDESEFMQWRLCHVDTGVDTVISFSCLCLALCLYDVAFICLYVAAVLAKLTRSHACNQADSLDRKALCTEALSQGLSLALQ